MSSRIVGSVCRSSRHVQLSYQFFLLLSTALILHWVKNTFLPHCSRSSCVSLFRVPYRAPTFHLFLHSILSLCFTYRLIQLKNFLYLNVSGHHSSVMRYRSSSLSCPLRCWGNKKIVDPVEEMNGHLGHGSQPPYHCTKTIIVSHSTYAERFVEVR